MVQSLRITKSILLRFYHESINPNKYCLHVQICIVCGFSFGIINFDSFGKKLLSIKSSEGLEPTSSVFFTQINYPSKM